jgi:D-lactate dehydrogenase (cytochrome)
MFISGSSLKVWVHNSPRLLPCRSRLLIVPRCQIASDARRYKSSFSVTCSAPRYNRKRTILKLLLSSLASGIVGYTIAKTTGPHLPAVSTENDAQESQYGTFKDVQNAIEELRLAFPSKDAMSTDTDVLRTHGVSRWDHRAGVYYDLPSYPCLHVYVFRFC